MKLEFFKYQGTGNDFVILDNRDNKYADLSSEQVNKICHRRFGIGADGLMLLSKIAGYDFEMVYYNADGNPSTMCGNGGRCLVQFAHQMGIVESKYYFKAIDGPHYAEIDKNGIIRLKMQDVHEVEKNEHFAILNTGSPHFVKFCPNVKDINVEQEGREIRNSNKFKENGINVNFVQNLGSDNIYVRTYERGVEDETMSCGTGVTAAALMCAHNERGFNWVGIKTLGGQLSVEYEKMGDQHFEDIWLCGPAEFVFKGEIDV